MFYKNISVFNTAVMKRRNEGRERRDEERVDQEVPQDQG